MRLTLGELAELLDGRRLAGDPAGVVSSLSVDSRSIAPGAVFVALKGARDGHDYVVDAFRAGAVAAVVTRAVPVPGGGAAGLVMVPDTADALPALGRFARARLEAAGVPVVGVTGSTGKTSTKDLMAAALAAGLTTVASPASWNNEIGVPLTLFSADEKTEVVVAEMGSRGAGHIRVLCDLARPSVGVVTGIGVAHTEFFGSRAEVARAKGELLEALPESGHAVLNADDDLTPGLAARSPASVLTVGADPSAGVRVSGVTLDDELRPSFTVETPWGTVGVGPLPLRGAHQAHNAGFALAVAGLLGVPLEAAAAGLAGATGSAWRMDLIRTQAGLVVLNDAYNANPTSMAAALGALGALTGGRRFAVLGYMAELGAASDEEHHRIGRLAAAAGVETLVVVGREGAALAAGATEAGIEVVTVRTAREAVGALGPLLRPGDAVLVKASRVVGLERVADALRGLVPGGSSGAPR